MKTLALLLLITSCATPKHYQVTTKLTCPNGSTYSFQDGMCHYSIINKPKSFIKQKNMVKANKAKLDCKLILKQVNQCTR